MDLIKQLGPMALGSRLKRLTIRMNKDISLIYRKLGIEFEARWFPVWDLPELAFDHDRVVDDGLKLARHTDRT